MDERIGVVGLGRMGCALAERFAGQGATVSGWTRSGVSPQMAKDAGFAPVVELSALVEGSDILVLSLFNDVAVQSVLSWLAELDLTGKLVVETSTVSPDVVRGNVSAIAAAGGALVDAPISGGPDMVKSGTVGLFVGGDEANVERFMPVAALVSDKVKLVGPLGAGAAAKIVNNLCLTAMWEVYSEAMEVGEGLGLEFETMLDFLKQSPAASPAFLQRMPIISGESDAVGFSVAGITKDATLIAETGNALGRSPAALEAALRRYQRMVDDGLGDQDLSKVVPHSFSQAREKG
jgi:3-hydroxyisobutyrate dehydrogenase